MRYFFSYRLLVLALLWLLTSPLAAQHPNRATSVADILTPDGAIRPGTAGSFDATGYRLAYAPDGGPVLRPAAAGDEHWRAGFTLSGTDGIVTEVAVMPTGDVYVAGAFDYAGTTRVNNIARWDGTRWWPLRGGITGGARRIYALAVWGNDLYVGGQFASVDNDTTIRQLARWDGVAWHAVPGRPNAIYRALQVANNRLYAATSYGVEVWDGTLWQALNSSLNGTIYALAVGGSHVYIGGTLTGVDGVPVHHVAHWNGAQWQPLGAGVDTTVQALALLGGDLYVGGDLTTAGNQPVRGIARWNGTTWSAVGSGCDPVRALLVAGNQLYAGSSSDPRSSNETTHQISRWDGTAWRRVGAPGVQAWTQALAADGTTLLAGGYPGHAGSIIRWDGTDWAPLGAGLTDAVYAIARIGTDIYVGGDFYQAGGVPAHYLARWDGAQWHALPASPDGWVDALAVRGQDLYVGGNFTQVGAVAANHIARWDGTQWHALAGGTDGPVYTIACTSASVFVGGKFTLAGNGEASNIAHWDGSTWQALGRGVRPIPADAESGVYALAATDSVLYVGGVFDSVGTIAGAALARWANNQWSSMGNLTGSSLFVGNYVTALAVVDSGLFVGGRILPSTNQRMALGFWNHASWTNLIPAALAGQSFFDIWAMAASPHQLCISGTWLGYHGLTNNIARWDGTQWHSLGSGLNKTVYALAVHDSTIYAGGDFMASGDGSRRSCYFAIYDPTYTYVNGLTDEDPAPTAHFALYPNPATGTVRLAHPPATKTTALLLDAAGREVRRASIGFDGALDVSGLPPGLYLVRIGTATARLVVE